MQKIILSLALCFLLISVVRTDPKPAPLPLKFICKKSSSVLLFVFYSSQLSEQTPSRPLFHSSLPKAGQLHTNVKTTLLAKSFMTLKPSLKESTSLMAQTNQSVDLSKEFMNAPS
jgi:hypothetical protein